LSFAFSYLTKVTVEDGQYAIGRGREDAGGDPLAAILAEPLKLGWLGGEQ